MILISILKKNDIKNKLKDKCTLYKYLHHNGFKSKKT